MPTRWIYYYWFKDGWIYTDTQELTPLQIRELEATHGHKVDDWREPIWD